MAVGCYLSLEGIAHAQCYDPDHRCAAPCPVQNPCESHEDCQASWLCNLNASVPTYCACSPTNVWGCFPGRVGKCVQMQDPLPPANYAIIDLGTIGGGSAKALSINNYGAVVGESDGQAFLWVDGDMRNLGQGRLPWTSGLDINNHFEVLIQHGSDNAIFWSNNVYTPIVGLNPAGAAYGQAINGRGQVVGSTYVYEVDEHHAFLWQNGILTDLTDEIGIGGASDLNTLGQIPATSEFQPGHQQAAFWDGTQLIPIVDLGGTYSYATSINDSGTVVGRSERPPGGDRIFSAFLWNGVETIDIAAATGKGTYDSTLNNCGEVLVSGEFKSGATFFRFRSNETIASVRGATPPYAEWHHLVATKMNDYGEIVGYGTLDELNRGFLLRPFNGDVNIDGYIDLIDFSLLQNSFTGSQLPAVPGCMRADQDRDGDVDLLDVMDFTRSPGGVGG